MFLLISQHLNASALEVKNISLLIEKDLLL